MSFSGFVADPQSSDGLWGHQYHRSSSLFIYLFILFMYLIQCCRWSRLIDPDKWDFLIKYVFATYSTNFHQMISHWNNKMPVMLASYLAASKWSIHEFTALACWRLPSLLFWLLSTRCYLIGPCMDHVTKGHCRTQTWNIFSKKGSRK